MGRHDTQRARATATGMPGGGVAGSVALHLLVLAALLIAVPKPSPPPPKERKIEVQILDQRQFEELSQPPAPVLPAPAMAVPAEPPSFVIPVEPRENDYERTIVADHILSTAVLDDPRSAGARAALPQLGSGERIVQLCSIEALEQIAQMDDAYEPDLLAAYSMNDLTVSPTMVDAPGAAFRSKGHWYNLAFKCEVSRSLEEVTSFEFRLGRPIPENQWESHHLASGEDQDED